MLPDPLLTRIPREACLGCIPTPAAAAGSPRALFPRQQEEIPLCIWRNLKIALKYYLSKCTVLLSLNITPG